MAPPRLTEDEIDDLQWAARAGEISDLKESVIALASRENTTPAAVLVAATDDGKATCLHKAAGNGLLGELALMELDYDFEGPRG